MLDKRTERCGGAFILMYTPSRPDNGGDGARLRVVLAPGEFAHNATMVEQRFPELSGRPRSPSEEHDGQEIRAAQWLGADVAQVDRARRSCLPIQGLMARGVLVGPQCRHQRGHLPQSDWRRTDAAPRQPGVPGDGRTRRREGGGRSTPRPCWAPATCPSWRRRPESLRANSRTPSRPTICTRCPGCGSIAAQGTARALLAVDGRRDADHRAAGFVDEALQAASQRPAERLRGLHQRPGLGLPVGRRATDVDGDPVPGLYAAGRTTPGLASRGYASGCWLGNGSFFGRRPGATATAGDGS